MVTSVTSPFAFEICNPIFEVNAVGGYAIFMHPVSERRSSETI